MTTILSNSTPLDPTFNHPSPSLVSAYKECFQGEKMILSELKLASTEARMSELAKQLKNVRVLGHLLVHGPSDASKKHIMSTIFSSGYRKENQDSTKPWLDIGTTTLDMLVREGQYYDTYLLRPCQLQNARPF